MYDYATQNMQRQILTEIQNTNTKIDNLTTGINNSSILIASLITIIIIKELVKKCLGGK